MQALGEKFSIPYIDLDRHLSDVALLQLIPSEVAHRHLVFPVSRTATTLTLAMADPVSAFAVADIRFMTGMDVKLVVATESGVRRAIDRFYEDAESLQTVMASMEGVGTGVIDKPGDLDDTIGEIKQAVEEAPVIKLVNLMLAEAIRRGASDIHAEPFDKTFRVRFRIDGVLYEVMSPPMHLKNAIISRLKIMAELDISERRAAAGRAPRSVKFKGPRGRFPRLHAAEPLRREGRHAPAGQVPPHAGHDEARL